MGVFAIYESRLAKPILPVHILKIRSLTTSSIVRGLSFSSMFSVFFFGALYLEKVLGYAPLRTGLAFLPMTLIMAFMSLGLTSRLLMRYGPIRLLVPGTLAVIVGLLLLTRTGVHSNYLFAVLPSFVLLGAGMSISAVPLLTIAMADVPKADAGIASGIVNVSMWLASSAALAVFGTLAASTTSSRIRAGVTPSQALVDGFHLTFFAGVICATSGLLVTLMFLRTPSKEVASGEVTFDEVDDGEYDVFVHEI